MKRRHKKPWGNFRFRFRANAGCVRPDDPVGSVLPSKKERRRRRWRLAMLGTKCAAFAAVGVVLLTFAARVWRETTSLNDAFTVGEFGYESNVSSERGGLGRQTILDVTGLRSDVNVMQVNLQTVHDALLTLPQIRSAEVRRFFPNRIDIRLEERRPVAWLECAAKDILPRDTIKGRLLDEAGVVFPCRALLSHHAHLPVLGVPALTWAEDGKPLADLRALRALDLLNAVRRQSWPRPFSVLRLDVLNDYSILANFSDDAKVVFGLENIPRQVSRLAAIYGWAESQGKNLESASLLAEQNVPATFFPSTTKQSLLTSSPGPLTASPASSQPPVAAAASRPVQGDPASERNLAQEDRDIHAILRGN